MSQDIDLERAPQDKSPAEWKHERQRLIREEGRIRAVTCPRCGAKTGESCHSTPGWYETRPHAARRKAVGL